MSKYENATNIMCECEGFDVLKWFIVAGLSIFVYIVL